MGQELFHGYAIIKHACQALEALQHQNTDNGKTSCMADVKTVISGAAIFLY